jgi:HTH-type transcriptional regulator/antitoxin HigA
MIKERGKMTLGIASYSELLQTYQPRPIVTEAQYDHTVAQMNALLDANELTADEQDLLTLLGTLVTDYEAKHYPDEMFDCKGIELLKVLMAERGLKQKDLVPIFKTKSIVSAVLRGKRQLTVAHIDQLAAFFDMPHEAFFE